MARTPRPARTAGSCTASSHERPRYAELQVTSHFSFLRGASSCEELFAQAAALGIEALAIVDRNSLAGIVRAHQAAKDTGVRLIVGCRLDLVDGFSLLVYPTDRPAYARLCRLLSLGKKRGGKAKCRLDWSDLVAYGEGLIAVLVPDVADDACALQLRRLREAFGDRGYLALTLRRRPNDQLRLHELANLAAQARVPTVVTNDVLFHVPERRILQDVVTCIRHGVSIDDAGFRRERHADRYLKPPEEMARLFRRYPEALARTLEIAERCRFSLDELAYQYPREAVTPGLTPQQALERLTWEGAATRYPGGPARRGGRHPAARAAADRDAGVRALLPDGELDRALRPLARTSCARGAARRRTRPSATCSASPRSIPSATTCCSSASSPRSAASRPTSTSTSSTSAARSSCSGCSRPMAAITPRSARR